MLIAGAIAAVLSVTALTATATEATAATGAAASTGPAGVKAPYAEVANATTGAILWSQDPTAQVPMGSIAKVMTAYVVIESGNLNRLITVPKGITAYDKKYGASTAGLKPGEVLTARQLLYAMLVPSGCDAAFTLAKAYGPGRTAFLAKMNATAAQLGLAGTHFTDPAGLPDPTETSTYSDAQDLVTLGRDAMQLPLFAKIVSLAGYTLPKVAGDHPAFTWTTTNPLIGVYPGTLGIKTGNTKAAKDCLLFEAEQNGEYVIGVVLGDKSWKKVTSDAETLLNWVQQLVALLS
jgi:D-alanyl-D-alanine carboxypeptidase (penicillin-binding protein 5/6)